MRRFVRFRKARVAVMMQNPFIGYLLLRTKPVADRTIPQFGIDNAWALHWNPDNAKQLSSRQMAHEIMHAVVRRAYAKG